MKFSTLTLDHFSEIERPKVQKVDILYYKGKTTPETVEILSSLRLTENFLFKHLCLTREFDLGKLFDKF